MRAPRSWDMALLRVMLGVIFVMHGYLALAVAGPANVSAAAVHLGFPQSQSRTLAWYLIAAHLPGGALLVIGLWTRLIALLQVPVMAAAVVLLHGPQGFFMRAVTVETPTGTQAVAGGYEYSLLVLVATVTLALTGGGAWSLDGVLARRPPIKVD